MTHVIEPTTAYEGELHDVDIFPFELDDFQKYAIRAIQSKENVLITAHTGSGKSVPAEYAIHHYGREQEQEQTTTANTAHTRDVVIYTSPIKSLTNQKFYDFQRKFPEQSFGILTGDIKYNTDANCLLMTTEILRNALLCRDKVELAGFEQFNLDLSRVKCVIFDEIHYINDVDRGSVWEESIMWLPKEIPLVLLSATIDRAREFAEWVAEVTSRNTWFLSNERRVVPLEHNMIFCLPNYVWKTPERAQDKKTIQGLYKWMQSQSRSGKQSYVCTLDRNIVSNLENAGKLDKYLYRQRINLSPRFLMNSMANSLKSLDRLPAIVFLFSRKQVEQSAMNIQTSMFPTQEGDYSHSKTNRSDTEYQTTTLQTQVLQRATAILRRLTNWREYTETAEYNRLTTLLQKGVAYHHSGVHPIFREMIEILFQEGYIKLLFSTETLAVGVNMPARSVVMTVTKWDGVKRRCLYPHEYTQMAGRAGRRGMDTRGYVYHLFWKDMPMLGNYQHMLSGKPQTLVSKFKMSSLTVLRTVSRTVSGTVLPVQHASSKIDTITLEQLSNELTGTMIQQEIKRQYSNEETNIREKREKMKLIQEKMKTWETPLHILEQYHGMNKNNKKDKNERLQLAMKYNLTREYSEYRDWLELKDKLEISENVLSNIQNYIPRVVRLIVDHLCDVGRVVKTADGYRLTELGNTISQFHEISPYVAHEMELLEECCRTQDGTIELLATFAGGIIRMDDMDGDRPSATNSLVKQFFKKLDKIELDEDNWAYSQQEQIDIDDVGTRGVGLIDWVHQWCLAEDSERCKQILTEVHQAGVFLGEWVKMMLKMNHCAEELGRYFERQGKIECFKHCSEIPKLTLKSVVTNQSLYI